MSWKRFTKVEVGSSPRSATWPLLALTLTSTLAFWGCSAPAATRDLRLLRPPDLQADLERASTAWVHTQVVREGVLRGLSILPTRDLQVLLDDRARWKAYALAQEPN